MLFSLEQWPFLPYSVLNTLLVLIVFAHYFKLQITVIPKIMCTYYTL